MTNFWCISLFLNRLSSTMIFSWMIVSMNIFFFFLNYWRLVLFFISNAQVKIYIRFELTGKMIDEYYAFITTYQHVWPLKICEEHISKLKSCSVKESYCTFSLYSSHLKTLICSWYYYKLLISLTWDVNLSKFEIFIWKWSNSIITKHH